MLEPIPIIVDFIRKAANINQRSKNQSNDENAIFFGNHASQRTTEDLAISESCFQNYLSYFSSMKNYLIIKSLVK
jgi:hypothetical protein